MATSVTTMRNPIDDLVSQLDKPPEKPLGTIESELTAQRQRGATAREIMPQTLKAGLESTETAMRELQTRREKGAKELGELGERQAKEVIATEERFAAMRPEPIEFAPSQETAENLQNIAISMMLVGAIAGGGSKRSGIAGLKAMKGMVDGYRQGRKDIFDKEKTIFEKALETQKMKLEEVKSLYESAIRAQTAGQTAEANKLAKQLEAELQGGAMFVDIANKRVSAAQTLLDGAIAAGQKATEGIIKLDEAIEKRKLEREKMAQDAKFKQQELALREKEALAKSQDFKPPPQTVLEANRLRNTIIPKIEQAIPVLDRLSKEKSNLGVSKWSELTSLLAVDPRAAELRFKDDPEAINLILTLAYFRSKEFETAGKALTRKEDQILAPIVRGDLRVYEGLRNAMIEGSKTLKQEQMSMERSYPFVARENAAYRGELPGQENGKPGVPSVTNISIPPAAIELLKSDPQKYRESFERKYGVRADVYLGGGR